MASTKAATVTTRKDLEKVFASFPTRDLEDFEVNAQLGDGGFAHVVRATDKEGKEWALKLIPVDCDTLSDIDRDRSGPLKEVQVHLSLSDEPSILPCVDAFKTACKDKVSGKKVHMAVLKMPILTNNMMEWVLTQQPNKQVSSAAEEREVLLLWLQMVNAVRKCHQHGIYHKDIKLENFLMDERGRVVLTDFGLSQVAGEARKAVAGTAWTMSPAGFQLTDDGEAGEWWSLGVILYQLLEHGAWPFKQCWMPWQRSSSGAVDAAIRKAVLSGHVGFKQALSQGAKDLVRGLLLADPARRWGLKQVLSSHLITPDLLRDLARLHPALASDMEQLLQMQRQPLPTLPSVLAAPLRLAGTLATGAAGSIVSGAATTGHAAAAAAKSTAKSMQRMLVPGMSGRHANYDALDSSLQESLIAHNMAEEEEDPAWALNAGVQVGAGSDSASHVHNEELDSGQLLSSGNHAVPRGRWQQAVSHANLQPGVVAARQKVHVSAVTSLWGHVRRFFTSPCVQRPATKYEVCNE